MTRAYLLALGVAAAVPLASQYRAPRTADYQFAAGTADARALWVNPAGLAVEYGATVMGEIAIDRSRTGSLSLNQLTAGFNSRGVAFGYRRDLYDDTLTGHTWRIGGGRALEGIALGVGLSFHANGDGPTQRGLDLGVRYRLLPAVELGAVLREVGKPVVNDVALDVNGSIGLGVRLLPSVRLDAEGTVVDVAGGGLARSWRGGLAFGPDGPIHLQAIVDLDQDFAPARLVLAASFGGRDRVAAVVSGARPGGELELQGISVAGVATRIPD